MQYSTYCIFRKVNDNLRALRSGPPAHGTSDAVSRVTDYSESKLGGPAKSSMSGSQSASYNQTNFSERWCMGRRYLEMRSCYIQASGQSTRNFTKMLWASLSEHCCPWPLIIQVSMKTPIWIQFDACISRISWLERCILQSLCRRCAMTFEITTNFDKRWLYDRYFCCVVFQSASTGSHLPEGQSWV